MNRRFAGKIMQWTLVSLTCVVLAIVCVTPWHSAQAALAMTTSIDEVDAWQAVAAATLGEGTPDSISDSYCTILYIEVALTDSDAQAGCAVIIEVSYADDNWMKLIEFTGTAETPGADAINDASCTAGDTTLELDDSSTDDFDVVGRKWFVLDGTVGNSESVRTKSDSTNVVTLCQDILRNHADNTVVWDRVDEWVVNIPFGVAYVRTLINNTDADAGVHFTTRISKTTAL